MRRLGVQLFLAQRISKMTIIRGESISDVPNIRTLGGEPVWIVPWKRCFPIIRVVGVGIKESKRQMRV